MKRRMYTATLALALSLSAGHAFADQATAAKARDMGDMKMDCTKDMKGMKGMTGMKMDCPGKNSSQAAAMAEGEVKEIDSTAKTITLKHGPIKSKTVEMGAMTMTFAVKDAAFLKKVKPHDQVRFQVENVNQQPTVVSLLPSK
jgi:Cu(I)/Ag(I) efflux system protein CusF